MKTLAVLFLVFALPASYDGERFLKDNTLYQKDSYYKLKVYDEHDWKSFYKLKEANTAVEPPNYDLHLISAAIFFATNKLREEHKLKPLKFSPGLRDAAVVHTQEMVDKNFLDHFNSRNNKLRAPDQRMKLFGITAGELGENVDMTEFYELGETTYIQLAETIVKEFYDSPPHRKAMLSPAFTNLGCASIFETKMKNDVYPVKTTQDFCGAR